MWLNNILYISEKEDNDGDINQINQSAELNDLAAKLTENCLGDNAISCYRQDNSKARVFDLLNIMGLLFNLLKTATEPVFLITRHYDCEKNEAFYFFIGPKTKIKESLLKLSEDRNNLFEATRYY